jgi:hypothetical protein
MWRKIDAADSPKEAEAILNGLSRRGATDMYKDENS